MRTRKTSPPVRPVDCLQLPSPWPDAGSGTPVHPHAPTWRVVKGEASGLRFCLVEDTVEAASAGRGEPGQLSVPSKPGRAPGSHLVPEQPPGAPASPRLPWGALRGPFLAPCPSPPPPSVCLCTSQRLAVGADVPASFLGPCRACLVPFITTLTNPSRA